MEAQSSPHNAKPSSDLNALFEELEKRQPKKAAPPAAPPSSVGALVAPSSRKSLPPPPPSKRPSAPAPAPAQALRIDDEAELIEDDDADATGKHAASSEPILPVYDADVDDAPTIARSSDLMSLVVPQRSAPPPNSGRLPPPPSMRGRPSGPSSIAKLSAPAAPLKSASELPLPSRGALPRLTPPPSRSSTPAPSRPPAHAISQPRPALVSAPPPASSVMVAEARASMPSAPQTSTIPPVARSDRLTASPAPKRSSGLLFAAVAGFGLLALGGAAVVGIKSGALGAASGSTGAIVVTAAGPNGAAIDGVKVLVDGKTECTSSPCRIAIGSGTHFVRAEAPGHVGTADRAVSVESGGETSLHIALSPAGSPAPAAETQAPATPKPEAKADPVPEAASEAAPKSAPARAPGKLAAAAPATKKEEAKPADKPEKPVATGTGTLNINSIPMANVVVDGRPVGSTPVMGLSVSAGNHTIVFIHPEHGRKVVGAKVEAGKTATAAVRF